MNVLLKTLGLRTSQKGFTFIELLVCIIIIGIIAAIAIPRYLSFRTRACDVVAKQELKTCYKVSQVYFLNEPDGIIDNLDKLKDSGFSQSEGVVVDIRDGTRDNLTLYTWHKSGEKEYHCDSSGNIYEEDRT